MAVQSTMLPLGTHAPDFSLTDVVSNTSVSLSDFENKKALLVIFICRHCPYVKHVEREIAKIGSDFLPAGRQGQNSELGIVAISSNDPLSYPEDGPESLAEQAKELDFTFPYCFDETQEVGRAYHAACTPDFFLFDQNQKLVYRGQIDDSRPGNSEPTDGHDLRAAIEAVLKGLPVSKDQKPSIGCSIKWKS